MRLVKLDEKTFDKYAKNHPLSNYYQSSKYGKVMEKEGYDVTYVGLVDYTNKIIGASLVLSKEIFWFFKEAYLPHGFLLDYYNYDLVDDFTRLMTNLLRKNNYLIMTLDPLIINNKLNRKGEIIEHNINAEISLKILKNRNYKHKGFNKNFETRKPRYNTIVDLTQSEDIIYKTMNKKIRNKINKANKKGVTIYKGNKEDINTIFNFIKNKHFRNIEYYKSLLESFDKDIDIYIAKIESEKFVRNAKKAYENALVINEKLIKKLFDSNTKGKNKARIINKKMQSDIILSHEHKNLDNATKFFQNKYDGKIIGGAIVIKYNDETNLLIEGFNKKYSEYNPNYLLKWEMIKDAKENDYKRFNLNGISGNFNNNSRYKGLNEMKLGYSSYVNEYIGEFELIINKPLYELYKIFKYKHTKKRK